MISGDDEGIRMTQPSYPGVEYLSKQNSWKAVIRIDSERFYLGTFDSFEEAKARRVEAEQAKAESDDPLNHPFFKNIKDNANHGRKLSDDQVLEIRRSFHEHGDIDYDSWMSKFGVKEKTIRKALNGQTYPHLNAIVAPGKKVVGKAALRREAIRLYTEEKLSYARIVERLKVSSSTVSLWCRDSSFVPHRCLLSRENYQEMKQRVRTLYQDNKDCGVIAETLTQEGFYISRQTVNRWCKDLIALRKNDSHYREALTKRMRALKQARRPAQLTDEKVTALRQRAQQLGYADTRAWGEEFQINPRNIWAAVTGHTFKHLNETVAPVPHLKNKKPPKKPAKKRVREKRVLTPQQIEQQKAESAALRKLAAEERRFEKWANAGFPDWGEPVSM